MITNRASRNFPANHLAEDCRAGVTPAAVWSEVPRRQGLAHGHIACVHLLLNTSLLEPPSCLSFSETVPSVEELCRQLDIIEIQALMTEGFAAAIGLW